MKMSFVKRKLIALMVGVISIGLVGCGSAKEQTRNQTLTISAAASLTDCMEEMKMAFEKANPNVKLQFNFGASGTLQKQIEQGAPADVFFSAGMKQMKALKDEGLMLEDTIREVVSNRLVLIVPASSNTRVSFKGLNKELKGKLAIGEMESVPVGQYSIEVFNTLGVMDEIASNLVYAKDVREVLTWVETGNVEAGIVYETDAKTSKNVVICDTADESWHTPVTYPIGITKASQNENEARAFLEFLQSNEAKKILSSYGFTPSL